MDLFQFLDACLTWPMLPASILLGLVCLYWACVLLGAADFELFDFDLDTDLHAEGSLSELGFMPLRFLNLGRVPVMLWVSIFALGFWSLFWLINDEQTSSMAVVIFRNAGIALFATKVLTQPLRGKFEHAEPNPATGLIGQTCVITTSEANQSFGEASCATQGAPLTLTVRVADGALAKGERAEILDFSPEENIYLVRKVTSEV